MILQTTRRSVLTVLALAGLCLAGAGKPSAEVPVELGKVGWMRDFDAAAKQAAAHRKPILVLFQEVPGCGTCVDYGNKVLSHPLVVEAAETLFVPVAIYNNVPGRDERTLKQFEEKAWNNPVVRVVSPDRRDLTDRVGGDYTTAGIVAAMVQGLNKAGQDVPTYLKLLAEEAVGRRRGLETATFVMHCFWEGESALGAVPGVVSTLPGFIGRDEVVEVSFDSTVLAYPDLLAKAGTMDCADKTYTRSDVQHRVAKGVLGSKAVRSDEPTRPDKEPKYYLSQTPFKHVPMTALQAARVNAAIHRKQSPERYLSPRQRKLLECVTQHPTAEWPNAVSAVNMIAGWEAAMEVGRPLGLSW